MEPLTQNTIDKKSTKKKTVLIINLIYIFLILAIVAGGIYGYFYLTKTYEEKYTEAYNKALLEQKAIYDDAKADFDSAYEEFLAKEAAWTKGLEEKQQELNEANEAVAAIYAERQAEIDKEQARWNALSDEEKAAEEAAIRYNSMISELRSTNSEYAQIYVEYSKYLTMDLFNLSKEEALAYTELYEKKAAIEQEFWQSHPESPN